MKYQNAAEILPEKLLKELQTYVDGGYLYIPKATKKKQWGAESGSRIFYQERNKEIPATTLIAKLTVSLSVWIPKTDKSFFFIIKI